MFDEEFSEFFAGRKIELQILWDGMATQVKGTPRNYAWLAQRKIGKSALFKRFCNIAFFEQDFTAPLFYEFPDYLTPASVVAEEMATTFLKQWMAFLTKDPALMDIGDLQKAYEVSQTIKGYEEKFQNIFNAYYYHRDRVHDPASIVNLSLKLVDFISGYVDQKCILFLDEAQRLATRIYDDNNPQKKPVRCEGVIGTVMQNPRIWFMPSGSRISTLHYEIITGERANKVGKRNLEPLWEHEALELVKKIVEINRYEVYEGIEKDIYQLVGGNPYYILSLFKEETRYGQSQGKQKSFRTPKELKEVFEFEALHEKGEIFNFWLEHYEENAKLLNSNPPNRPGLSFEILKHIADTTIDKRDIYIPFANLAKKFDLSEEEFKEKIYNLENADLVRTNRWAYIVEGMTDRVFSLVIRQLEHFRKSKSSRPSPEAQAIMDKRLGLLESEVGSLRKDVNKAKKAVQRVSGTVGNLVGQRAEMDIEEKILQKKGWFARMKVEELQSITVPLGNGKGHQLDRFGHGALQGDLTELFVGSKSASKGRKRRKTGKVALVVEVKDREKKVDLREAKRFIGALYELVKKGKPGDIVAVYISKGGFTKGASDLLDKSGVHQGSRRDFEI